MHTDSQNQHSVTAIKNMTEMRKNSIFTDVTIKCGSLVFAGHRIVLAAHSRYLKAMFMHDMKEGENAPLEITAPLDPDATEKIFHYMYTGRINLDENAENVQLESILKAADYLLVSPVVKLCSDKLLASLSPKKFLKLWQTFEKYCMNQHKDSLVDYLSERFYQVQNSDEYLQLTHTFLRELIRNRNFPLSDDETVLALVNWTKHDLEARIGQLNLLLDNIHYSNMSPAFIIKFFEDSLCWQVPKLQKIIQRASVERWWKRSAHTAVMNIREEVITCAYFDHEHEDWLPKIDFSKPEQIKRENIVYVFAHINKIYFFTAEKVHCLDVETKTWTNYCAFSADNAEPFSFRAIFCGAYLYVFEPKNFRRLNVESNRNEGWEKIATLAEYEANRFLVVEFHGTIYIFNKTLQNSKSTLSVCCYDCGTNAWIPQSIEVNGMSSCVHLCLATAEYIYLMNGSNKAIYMLWRKHERWVVSMTRLENAGGLGFVKSLFYSSINNSFHMCRGGGLMVVCRKNNSDLPSVVDTANGFYKIGVYSYECGYGCDMLENDIDYVLSLNLCLG